MYSVTDIECKFLFKKYLQSSFIVNITEIFYKFKLSWDLIAVFSYNVAEKWKYTK